MSYTDIWNRNECPSTRIMTETKLRNIYVNYFLPDNYGRSTDVGTRQCGIPYLVVCRRRIDLSCRTIVRPVYKLEWVIKSFWREKSCIVLDLIHLLIQRRIYVPYLQYFNVFTTVAVRAFNRLRVLFVYTLTTRTIGLFLRIFRRRLFKRL